jgi:hypothetical protein
MDPDNCVAMDRQPMSSRDSRRVWLARHDRRHDPAPFLIDGPTQRPGSQFPQVMTSRPSNDGSSALIYAIP